MVRVRFTGEDLEGLETVAPGDNVRLFFEHDQRGAAVLPEATDDRGPERHSYREYTIRHFDAAAPWLDIDFLLHGNGVASRWARTATPGEEIGMLGPRTANLVRDVFDWYLFGVDQAALPAMARWLEALRPDVPVTAFVEIPDAADEQTLFTQAALTLRWLHRNTARGADSTGLLEQAIRSHPFPPGEGFVWIAGESQSIRPLRHYLASELGMDRENWGVSGYWRRGPGEPGLDDRPGR